MHTYGGHDIFSACAAKSFVQTHTLESYKAASCCMGYLDANSTAVNTVLVFFIYDKLG